MLCCTVCLLASSIDQPGICGKACPHALQGKAAEIKVKGNAAFKAKLYGEAIKHFTECVKLDPRCELQRIGGAAQQQVGEVLAPSPRACNQGPLMRRVITEHSNFL